MDPIHDWECQGEKKQGKLGQNGQKKKKFAQVLLYYGQT